MWCTAYCATVQYLNVRGVVTVVTLPGPHSIEAPDHLPTQVTPGGVVGAHLGQVGMGLEVVGEKGLAVVGDGGWKLWVMRGWKLWGMRGWMLWVMRGWQM